MEGKRLLRSLTLHNVLSFGPEGTTLEFEPLNVLIGPNGSGKSNLIEILGLLRALPRNISASVREAGGVSEWIWKGVDGDSDSHITAEWDYGDKPSLKHTLELKFEKHPVVVSNELIWQDSEAFFNKYRLLYESDSHASGGNPIVSEDGITRRPGNLRTDQSILSQRRDEDRYPELAYLEDRLSEIRIFRDWTFGPRSVVRAPQKADEPGDFLLANFSNLGLILNGLCLDRRAKSTLLENLRKVYEGVSEIRVRVVAGYVEVMIEENNGHVIPAVRLSDGTLRYLCLLAILCHPEPPPLICIEEPELGLHPDLMPTIAKLLIDASQRSQLIVTTHSVDLISALWEFPESVVVCERGFSGTTLKRLEPERLKNWLERYSLGELWESGEIGGNRW